METADVIRLLGPLQVTLAGAPVALPRSRKVRALLGFLALAAAPVSRGKLCDLLWDAASDPRGELRWCLSKLRSVLGEARVVTRGELVSLDLTGCRVDALEIDAATRGGLEALGRERLTEIADLFGGDLLDGLHLDATPELGVWLAAQRHRYRSRHVEVLQALSQRLPQGSDEAFQRLQAWLRLSPFDTRAHEVLLGALVQRGSLRDAQEHMAATVRAFEQEGLDWQPLREALSAVRDAPAPGPIQVVAALPPGPEPTPRRRASVAVMPFADPGGRVGDGLTDDLITRLAKLRVLFVIARGTTYALNDRHVSPQEAGRILNVEYIVSGRVQQQGERLRILFELAETQDGRIVWTDELSCETDAAFRVLDETVDRIVAAVAEEIEAAECQRAVLKPPSSLDAWEAYHRGLWHMYKFNGPDNRDAERFFRASLQLDPTFARAHAGLSFTHFQNAFLDLSSDRDHQIEQAFTTAVAGVGADDRDPAAHWAMGRALWLRGAQSESLAELRRSVDLSPNFALGHYTLGFVQAQQGDPQAAIAATDHSRSLSPFDPLQFAMLATRAIAHVRRGEPDEAAEWAVKGAARPNAHAHILAIAAMTLSLADRRDEARGYVARIRQRLPHYGVEDYLRAFRFAPETERTFRGGAKRVGFE